MKVKDLMRTKPATVLPDTPLKTVWDLLSHQRYYILPVVDNEGLIKGIITAHDLLLHLMPDYREFFSDFFPNVPTFEEVERKLSAEMHLTAADVMTSVVFSVRQKHDVFKALTRMLAYNRRVLPVTDEQDKLVGYIVEKDIFKYLFQKEKRLLKRLEQRKSK